MSASLTKPPKRRRTQKQHDAFMEAVKKSPCNQRAAKLLALLWGVVLLCDEIEEHKECNCAWHQDRDKALLEEFDRYVPAVGGACEMFYGMIQSCEPTMDYDLKLVKDYVDWNSGRQGKPPF